MVKGRFAPSPSGRMHLGNIYTALLSYLSAKSKGGSWLVRIEDLDTQRCKSSYTRLLLEDLLWLGLVWDEGPDGTDGKPNKKDLQYYQSTRASYYEQFLWTLEEKGLVYPCWCRRQDLLSAQAPHASDGTVIYSRNCTFLSEEEKRSLMQKRKPALRIRTDDTERNFTDLHYGKQKAVLSKDFGDFIVRRSDGTFAYQLAVTIDDALMGVTEVVRGRDLLSSTHIQRFLSEELNLPSPKPFHIPLLTDKDGRRLSKRDKDLDMEVIRANYKSEEVIGNLLFLAGQIEKNEPVSLKEAVSLFDAEKIPAADIVVK